MNVEEQKKALWLTAEKLGNDLNSQVRKQLVLGLVFLKCLTLPEDAEPNKDIVEEEPSVRSEISAREAAKTAFLQENTANADVAALIDKAIVAIENSNKNLAGIFYKSYSNTSTDKQSLREFVNCLEALSSQNQVRLQKESLTQLFEYLLTKFEESERENGQIYPPESVIKLLVEIVDPRKGKIYDSCCGTGDLFIQSEKIIKKYRGKIESISLYGQENNTATLQVAKMNLLIHGLDANLQLGDALTNDCFPGLEADYILSVPKYSLASKNDDYAWLQHLVYKLSPTGTACIVLKTISTNSSKGEDVEVRKNLIEDKIIDCVVALPEKLFRSADAGAVIWILSKIATNSRYVKAGNEILFIDARKSPLTKNGRSSQLSGEDTIAIARTYQRWKNVNGDYIDIKGICKAVSTDRIRKNGYSLAPEKYVKRSRVKIILPALLVIIALATFYFLSLQPGTSESKQNKHDSLILVQPPVTKDSTEPAEAKDTVTEINHHHFNAEIYSADMKDSPSVIFNKPAIKTAEPEVKSKNGITKYIVNSTAYFYNKPDERTRRKAFITHWNNSYADIQALREKNDFIYVVFINHLHQRSKGWLRKKDLREVNQ